MGARDARRAMATLDLDQRAGATIGIVDPRAAARMRAFVAYALDFVETMPPELPTASPS